MKKRKMFAWLDAETALIGLGLGAIAVGGFLMNSPLVGLVIPGGVLVVLGAAPLRMIWSRT